MSGPIVKWYASKWCNTPERMEFIRETEHMLFRRDFRRVRRERKVSKWGGYYDTYEEAQAAIDAFKAGKAAARARRRLTEAAPELLSELEYARTTLSLLRTDVARSAKVDPRWEGMDENFAEWLGRIDSAIAKATGEQP